MKRDSRRKNFIWAGSSLLLLTAFMAALFLALTSQVQAVPDNPIDGINMKRSQQLVVGKGFTIDRKQEQTRKKEEKKKQQQKQEASHRKEDKGNVRIQKNQEALARSDTDSGQKPEGGQTGNEAESPADSREPDPEEKEDPSLPTIETSLTNKEETAIGYKGFWVKASDRKKRAIDSSGLQVTINDEKIYRSGEDGKKVQYGGEIREGENTIRITAEDSEGKSRTLLYLIYGRADRAEETEGTVTVTIEAGTIGKGTILGPVSTDVTVNKPFPYALDKLLKEKGISYDSGGSFKNGFYLKRIYKNGITSGFQLPAELEQKLEDKGYTTTGHKEDSLGEKDFTTESGWMYQVNGAAPGQGMSGYTPKDGDNVRIRFTLWQGKDLGGQWGDW